MKRTLRITNIHFGSSVAVDRYRKTLKDADGERTGGNYARAAVYGGLLGAALRRPGVTRKVAAGIGAGAGVVAQGATRVVTARTKDQFGDRSMAGKMIDKVPGRALQGAALVAGYRRIAARGTAVKQAARRMFQLAARQTGALAGAGRMLRFEVAGDLLSGVNGLRAGRRAKTLARYVLPGAALAGGVAAADGVLSGLDHRPGQSTVGAVGQGLRRGAIYGSVLATAEPLLKRGLMAGLRRKSAFAIRRGGDGGILQFGGRQQLRDDGNRFLDPLEAAAGTRQAYTTDAHGIAQAVHLPVVHGQVVRAALNRGRKLHTTVSRAGGLIGDAAGSLAGRPKVDSRGRAVKKEWEKSWFKRAVGSAVLAGGLLGHARLMRKSPGYRARIQSATEGFKNRVNRIVPDTFPTSLAARETAHLRFDDTAPDWDVRDGRGRSARVFAPGSKPRDRREKRWYEKTKNIRRIAVAGAAVGLAGGGLLGWKLRDSNIAKARSTVSGANILPFRPAA